MFISFCAIMLFFLFGTKVNAYLIFVCVYVKGVFILLFYFRVLNFVYGTFARAAAVVGVVVRGHLSSLAPLFTCTALFDRSGTESDGDLDVPNFFLQCKILFGSFVSLS